MNEAELLARLSQTLKKQIGPAVEGEYPKTQAFMAAVVLQKLAGQLGSEKLHNQLHVQELTELAGKLKELGDSMSVNADLMNAIELFSSNRSEATLCDLVRCLYKNSSVLGEESFMKLLSPIRVHLRCSIDRRMEYAK